MGILDYFVVAVYVLALLALAWRLGRKKADKAKIAENYFLAGNSLRWWAVGASLIALSISAEQLLQLTGDGYSIGLAIASYEWMGAITLIIVAKFFLPVLLEKKIYTLPQFLEMRFDGRIRSILAVFWVGVYVFINLSSILYIGAFALQELTGLELWIGALMLAVLTAIYSLSGGLLAIARTDGFQLIVLVVGGLIATAVALAAVGQLSGGGIADGLSRLSREVPERFQLLFSGSSSLYQNMPGLTVLVGGMWLTNLFYWGFNQYTAQRALAATDLREAQKGLAFAAALKIALPLILVIPGIAVFYLNKDISPDTAAYSWLYHNHIPAGLKGFALIALLAAIISSLGSVANAISAIFTIDIYERKFEKNKSDKKRVRTGQRVAGISLGIAFLMSFYFENLTSLFDYIKDFVGYVSPGLLAIFLAAMFYKKATANAAVWAAVLSIPVGYGFTALTPNMPFLDRTGIIFLMLCGLIVSVSLLQGKGKDDPKGFHLQNDIFQTGKTFNIASIAILGVLGVVYLLLG